MKIIKILKYLYFLFSPLHASKKLYLLGRDAQEKM